MWIPQTYADYELKAKSKIRNYFKDIFYEVKKVEGDARFRVTQTRAGNDRIPLIKIYDGPTLIFQCPNQGVAPRNLYLELTGAKYSISDWLLKRGMGEYNNYNYESAKSLPSSVQ